MLMQDCKITELTEQLHVVDRREAIPHLRAVLKHADAGIRELAAKQLGEIGPDAMEALPELTQLLQDPDQRIRDAAAQAIENIEK